IGGTSKGHLVREIDALGGEMGLAADDTLIQLRMLNTGKGPAVYSLRAQMDKRRYHERMKLTLEKEPMLTLMQGECEHILEKHGKVTGILTSAGAKINTAVLILCTGVYLKSRILIGDWQQASGPAGFMRAEGLSNSLKELGFTLMRFKTGTPARLLGKSIDYSKMQRQDGDVPMQAFSFLTPERDMVQTPCYLTYTNEATHEVIRANLHRSPMYAGVIEGTGARYCPSIEDKIVRFKDKDRHQVFIEPEGLSTSEMYVQGMSTSLPADVQLQALRTIKGLEKCEVARFGYAIEYDCIDPTALSATLSKKDIEGLYCAGQINGTSGYEEAAGQGLYAAINAANQLLGKPQFLLSRSDAYIGVMVDDLTIKGVDEPYRMMTSRAEYRLILRQDNADMRLTELAKDTGLISQERYSLLLRKREALENALLRLDKVVPPDALLQEYLKEKGEPPAKSGIRLFELLKRRGVRYTELLSLYNFLPELEESALMQLEIMAQYGGYIEKQFEEVKRMEALESAALPQDADYLSISGLRTEARQKLAARKPKSIGAAGRIPGVSPADVAVLLIWRKAQARRA
ncbi:MAG TPA: tRNA uridine-5-carboxymethylaminomethyl(34) synthesis enzyme MnmG, partial [Clostridia bacterium]|nr:tRNA uridine-5-carboxymethylaminomethyl(34) synthesis enzyme MnmG [Clostridia bacterium]